MTNKSMKTGASLAICIFATSCVSLKPPARPAYTGADTVNTATASQLLGAWAVRSLNPFPNEEPQETTIEYKEGGTVIGTLIPQGESVAVLGDIQFELTGNWILEGDQVIHSDIQMNANSENPMAAILSNAINNSEGIAGEGNIYELSANRMVIVGTDGSAMEYRRQ